VEESRALKDNYNRAIDYLRISVTDRCNLRCIYCMPEEGVKYIPCSKILRYEEIVRLSDIFIEMGIRKIRITGGEPLLRENILFLIGELGKKRVNVSLDSLNRETFRAVTRHDGLGEVLRGVEEARQAGLLLKINVVAMRGINDEEFLDFVQFGLQRNLPLRFIEVMPQFYSEAVVQKRFIGAEDILERIRKKHRVTPLESRVPGSVERLYRIDKTDFQFGIIGAITEPFCSRCNRVRLMANGIVKTCLFGPEGPNLKTMLLEGATENDIKKAIRAVIMEKPEKHSLDESSGDLVMHKVGG